MSKATPIEQLPNSTNASGTGNVQMQMSSEQIQGSQSVPPQPQQHMNQYPNPQMHDGHPMYQQMNLDQERHPTNVQNNFMNRQFVHPPITMDGRLPDDPEPSGAYHEQMTSTIRGPTVKSNDYAIMPKENGIFKLLQMESKTLLLVFSLLVCIQLETTQGLFRKLTRMMKVPDSMVFTSSKVFAAMVGVLVFFFVRRNL